MVFSMMKYRNREMAIMKQLEAEDLYQRDALSNLYNRLSLNKYIEEMRKQSIEGIILLDIDNFKSVNDTYGHLAGDKVIEGQKMFTYINAVDDPDVTTVLNKLIDDKAAIESLGNISVTSKVTGVIQDIKIYSTVPTSEMSKSLRKFCEDIYNKEV